MAESSRSHISPRCPYAGGGQAAGVLCFLPGATFDLADEAAFQLGEAIALAREQRWKCLRVIHGGSPGRFGPVQNAVSRMLSQNHRHVVERTQFEPGNTGATLVFLKQG